jgi:hypothetical protein
MPLQLNIENDSNLLVIHVTGTLVKKEARRWLGGFHSKDTL